MNMFVCLSTSQTNEHWPLIGRTNEHDLTNTVCLFIGHPGYTKMNIYVPTTKRCDSVELAKLLMDAVVRRYGVPKGILSDRGSLFTSQYWSEFAYEARVKHKLSTAFHPRTDGQTERMNQTLEQYLRCYCSEKQDSWPEMLAQAEFAVNNSVHYATRMSPFELLYGWNPEIRDPPIRDELHEERVLAATERAR